MPWWEPISSWIPRKPHGNTWGSFLQYFCHTAPAHLLPASWQSFNTLGSQPSRISLGYNYLAAAFVSIYLKQKAAFKKGSLFTAILYAEQLMSSFCLPGTVSKTKNRSHDKTSQFGSYHIFHTSKYWNLLSPNIILPQKYFPYQLIPMPPFSNSQTIG